MALGVFPKPVLDRITPSVNQLVIHVDRVTNTPVPPASTPVRVGRDSPGRPLSLAGPRQSTTVAEPSPVPEGGAVTAVPLLVATSATPTIHTPHVDYLSILPMLIMMGGALVPDDRVLVVPKDPGCGHRDAGRLGRCPSPPWLPRSSSGTR